MWGFHETVPIKFHTKKFHKLTMKKIAIAEMITRKITEMPKNTHGKKLTIFFT